MIPPALQFVPVAGTGTVITVSGRATRCPLDSEEKLPKARVPAGIWMLSLGRGASRQGDRLPAVGVLAFLLLETERQVTA